MFLQICEEFKDADSYSQHKYQCLKHLNDVYDIMDRAGLHPLMPKPSGKALTIAFFTTADCQWGSHVEYYSKDALGLGLLFKWLNPKFYSCYQGETMVGHMSALGPPMELQHIRSL